MPTPARMPMMAMTIPWRKYRGLDTMQLAARVAEVVAEFQPDAVFVDVSAMVEAVKKNKTISTKRNHLNFALADISSSRG